MNENLEYFKTTFPCFLGSDSNIYKTHNTTKQRKNPKLNPLQLPAKSMAKSSKRSSTGNSTDSNKKKKKSKKSAPEGVAMKVKAKSNKSNGGGGDSNPFESIWSRRKFEVLGQKRKGEARRMGLARSLAIEKRNNTLLKEYQQSAKSSLFVDRRIGENDNALDEFGKAIMRSQRERQVLNDLLFLLLFFLQIFYICLIFSLIFARSEPQPSINLLFFK